MRVYTKAINPALQSLFENCEQVIFLDANCLIPPDRSKFGAKAISFTQYETLWLNPLFDALPNLAIHESVYAELVSETIRNYIDKKANETPPRITLFYDADLNPTEKQLYEYQISRIAPYSEYVPEIDNAKDRGEIKSLSYMAVKHFLHFAANDQLPYHLVREIDYADTGLEGLDLLQSYEIIYYLHKTKHGDGTALKMLYKYQYRLTKAEKSNPEWPDFLSEMDKLYFPPDE